MDEGVKAGTFLFAAELLMLGVFQLQVLKQKIHSLQLVWKAL